jgi:3-hydroxybutyryl-CoA dehydratase
MSIHRKLFPEIQIGDKADFTKTMTESDIFAFSAVTGDFNPVHVDKEFAKNSIFKQRVVHGMLTSGLIDTTLTALGGAGNIHLSETLKFTAPVFIGDTITVTSEVVSKDEVKWRVTVKSIITKQDGTKVVEGEGILLIPREKK